MKQGFIQRFFRRLFHQTGSAEPVLEPVATPEEERANETKELQVKEYVSLIDEPEIFSVAYTLGKKSSSAWVPFVIAYLQNKEHLQILPVTGMRASESGAVEGRYQDQLYGLGAWPDLAKSAVSVLPEVLEEMEGLQKKGETLVGVSANRRLVGFFVVK